jgi:hypothetical protein
LVATVAAALPVERRGFAGALAQTGNVTTGGIGLARDKWESAHGAGDTGQNVVSYEGGAIYVQFAGDVVVYVEAGWEDRGGLAADEVSGMVRQLIPSDASLKEGFYAPPTPVGPAGLRFERYQSKTLASLMGQVADDRTGGILVVYQETPAADRFEPNVARINISVGSKGHTSVLDRPSGQRGLQARRTGHG